jgi:hypothetical protein
MPSSKEGFILVPSVSSKKIAMKPLCGKLTIRMNKRVKKIIPDT